MSQSQHAAAPGAEFASNAEFYLKSLYGEFKQEHLSGGSFGLSMIDVEQPAIDLVDAPLPDFIFAVLKTPVNEASISFGSKSKRTVDYAANTLFLTPPETEATVFVSEDHAIRVVSIPAKRLNPLIDRANLQAECFHPHLADRRDLHPQHSIAAIVNKMWCAATRSASHTSLLLDGLTLQMIALAANSASLSPFGSGHPEDIRIRRVIEYVEAHVANDLTVTELAAVACLSPGHFSRTFKATTGEAVWSYVQRRRCERACDMLLGTRDPIAHIAYACGFANQAHMTRQLSARFGATPGAIRRDA